MNTNVYQFNFNDVIPLLEAEASLQLAIFAAEGLYGGARVRMDVSYHADEPRNTIVIDGTTDVGSAVIRMFTALLIREFGEDAFSVRPVEAAHPCEQVLVA